MTIWVVLNAKGVSDKLTDLVDRGELASANALAYAMSTFIEKLRSFCQQNGGSLTLALYERCVMSLSLNAAEQIPDLIKEYSRELHGHMCAGMGMTVGEASAASRLSSHTNQIELYDPAKTYPSNYLSKQEPHAQIMDLPPNIFDPELPDTDDNTKLTESDKDVPDKSYLTRKKINPVLPPDAQSESKASSQLLQTMMQEVGFMPPQQPQQAGPPRDLLETLHGSQIPGRDLSQEKDKQEMEQQIEAQVTQAKEASEETNQKLAGLLAQVKDQLPAIMQLHDTNPQAFKQSMNVISKLLTLASKRSKTSKSEETVFEQIEKMVRHRLRAGYKSPGGRHHQVYPVGTRIGRKKKVLVNGKAVWRSMASGQVKDSSGSSVSVLSSNSGAKNE